MRRTNSFLAGLIYACVAGAIIGWAIGALMSRVIEYQLRDTICLRNYCPDAKHRIRVLLHHLFAWAKARGYLPPDEQTAAERLEWLEQTIPNAEYMRPSRGFGY